MKELIKIKQEDGFQTVNARELHTFLNVGRDFNTWIKERIKKYGFEEDIDFSPIPGKSNGGRREIIYSITIDMAKELSMVENNEKGREARRYFIECERTLKSIIVPQNFSEALRLAADQAEQIEEMKPKVETYDALISSGKAVDFSTCSKNMNLGVGRNNLLKILRGLNILQEKPKNEPYQKYVDRGYFKVILQPYDLPNGNTGVNRKTVIFPKGEEFVMKAVKKHIRDNKK